jgi:cell division protein YceG involved in septum cleavage
MQDELPFFLEKIFKKTILFISVSFLPPMKFFTFIVFLCLFLLAYLIGALPGTRVASQDFVINPGETFMNLPKKLSISVNPTLFKIYTRFIIEDFTLQAGTYSIKTDTTIAVLFSDILRHPSSKDITITFLPGWNIWDMDAYLAKQGVIGSGDFIAVSENISPEIYKAFPFL